MDLKRIKKQNTFDAAVKAIGAFILTRGMVPGDAFPPEPELAASLGISRNVLREALRHYRTLGLIESKPRRGTVLRTLIPDNPYAGYFPILAVQTDLKPKLAEMREALEVGFVPQIIQRFTDADLVHLKNVCKRFKTAYSQEQIMYADMEFHIALLEIAANPLLTGLVPLVVHFFTTSSFGDEKDDLVNGEREYQNHIEIVSALSERDAARVVQLFRKHYVSYHSDWSAQ